MSDDLVKRLHILSQMINLGERVAWGQDTALMDEAAAEITRLRAQVEAADELAETMRFYADLSHEGPWHLPVDECGKRARAALTTYQQAKEVGK